MSPATWLQVSLTTDGELAEAVAEVLARFAPSGVAIESTSVSANPDDSEGRAVGPWRVLAYLPMDDQIEATRRRVEEALWYLGRIRSLPPAQFEIIQETDWSQAWKAHYHPIPIGRRLVIVPAWMDPPDRERLPVRIDPGMAFGTGTHPTTQLCLELVEGQMSAVGVQAGEEPGEFTVIDLGCGTAILAVAALKLGASRALGVDIDAEAIQAAQENAQANGVSDRLELGLGSLAEIQAGEYSLKQADLVLANILAPVLVSLLDAGLSETVATGGSLVLSGILEDQCTDVEVALGRNGLALVERKQIQDWVALRATRRPGHPPLTEPDRS